jgi:hypothetical protein
MRAQQPAARGYTTTTNQSWAYSPRAISYEQYKGPSTTRASPYPRRIYGDFVVTLVAPSVEAGGYDLCPKAVRRSSALSMTAIAIYQEVLCFAQSSQLGACSASTKTIGNTIGRGERATRDAIKQLIDIGLLRAESRTATTNMLWPVELTPKLLLRLKPHRLTHSSWRALWEGFPEDKWVKANCPEVVRAGDAPKPRKRPDGPPKGRQISAALTCKSLTALPHNKTSSYCSVPAPEAREQDSGPEHPPMARKPKPRLNMRGALDSKGYREERKRREDRVGKSAAQQGREVNNPPPCPRFSNPMDLRDVKLWRSHDFVRLVRALTSAQGIECAFREKQPNGKWVLTTAGANKLMNQLLDLMEASGVAGKRRQALFLINWIKDWDKFCKAQPQAARVGFAPRYWIAAWKNIFPWLKSQMIFDSAYADAAVETKTEVANSIVAQLKRIYVNWPNDPDLDKAASTLMARWPFTTAREFKAVVRQHRLDPRYVALWEAIQDLQKA